MPVYPLLLLQRGREGVSFPGSHPPITGDSAEPGLGPSSLPPPTDRLDPPGGQVLALHPAGQADRAAGAAGAGPGAGFGLLRPERPLGLHPDPAEGLLGAAGPPRSPGPPPPAPHPLALAWGRGPSRTVTTSPLPSSSPPASCTPVHSPTHGRKWPSTGRVPTSPSREVEAGSWDCHPGVGVWEMGAS